MDPKVSTLKFCSVLCQRILLAMLSKGKKIDYGTYDTENNCANLKWEWVGEG